VDGGDLHNERTGAAPDRVEELDPAILELLGVPRATLRSTARETRFLAAQGGEAVLLEAGAQRRNVAQCPVSRLLCLSKPQNIGDHAVLSVLHGTVPFICPSGLGHGKLAGSSDHFLLMEWCSRPSG
jgi:hypothetical protein